MNSHVGSSPSIRTKNTILCSHSMVFFIQIYDETHRKREAFSERFALSLETNEFISGETRGSESLYPHQKATLLLLLCVSICIYAISLKNGKRTVYK